MKTGTVIPNGDFETSTYIGCCRRCQARPDCGGFYWSSYYETCTLYSFGFTTESGGWWQSVGIMEGRG